MYDYTFVYSFIHVQIDDIPKTPNIVKIIQNCGNK